MLLTPNTTAIDEPGGNITYEIQLKNTSPATIEVLSLADDQIGDLDGVGTCNTAVNPYPTVLATLSI